MKKILLVLSSALLFGQAQATDLPLDGGPGGAPFRDACAPGQFLVGVSVRSGGWLIAIAPLCATFRVNERVFDKWQRGPRHGGTAGSPLLKDAACPRDRYLSGIQVAFTLSGDTGKIDVIDAIQITCTSLSVRIREKTTVCLQTGDGCGGRTFSNFPGGFKILPPAVQDCGREAATGLHGRTGAFVDAVGLICGPKPMAGIPIRQLGKRKP